MSHNKRNFNLNNAFRIHPKSIIFVPTVPLERKIPCFVSTARQYATRTMMLTHHPLKFYPFKAISVIVSKESAKLPERPQEFT